MIQGSASSSKVRSQALSNFLFLFLVCGFRIYGPGYFVPGRGGGGRKKGWNYNLYKDNVQFFIVSPFLKSSQTCISLLESEILIYPELFSLSSFPLLQWFFSLPKDPFSLLNYLSPLMAHTLKLKMLVTFDFGFLRNSQKIQFCLFSQSPCHFSLIWAFCGASHLFLTFVSSYRVVI